MKRIIVFIIFCLLVGNLIAQDTWWEQADSSNYYKLENIKILVIVGHDYDWHETTIIPERWKEWGASIVYTSNNINMIGHIKKKLGNTFNNDDTVSIKVDVPLTQVNAYDYDIVYFPGGYGPMHLLENQQSFNLVTRLINDANDSKKLIAAICHGPLLLAATNIIEGKTLTGHRSVESSIIKAGGKFIKQKVVVDGNIITGNWPYFESFASTVAKIVELRRSK